MIAHWLGYCLVVRIVMCGLIGSRVGRKKGLRGSLGSDSHPKGHLSGLSVLPPPSPHRTLTGTTACCGSVPDPAHAPMCGLAFVAPALHRVAQNYINVTVLRRKYARDGHCFKRESVILVYTLGPPVRSQQRGGRERPVAILSHSAARPPVCHNGPLTEGRCFPQRSPPSCRSRCLCRGRRSHTPSLGLSHRTLRLRSSGRPRR